MNYLNHFHKKKMFLVDANMYMMLSSLCTTTLLFAFLCNTLGMPNVLCLSRYLCFVASKSIKYRYSFSGFFLIWSEHSYIHKYLQIKIVVAGKKNTEESRTNHWKISRDFVLVIFVEMEWHQWFTSSGPAAGNYMLKVNNRNTRTRRECFRS